MIVYPTIFRVSYKPVNLCHNQQSTQDHQPLDQRHTRLPPAQPSAGHDPKTVPSMPSRPNIQTIHGWIPDHSPGLHIPKRNAPSIKNGVVDCMFFDFHWAGGCAPPVARLDRAGFLPSTGSFPWKPLG